MKFPRHLRLQRSPLDAAPFAAVFFILVVFVLLSLFLPVPGLPLQLPVAEDLPGTGRPSVTVAVGGGGRLYFENQIMTEKQLQASLADAATRSPEPLTLVIMADKGTTYDQLVHLAQLARQAGLRHALLATLPRLLDSPAQR